MNSTSDSIRRYHMTLAVFWFLAIFFNGFVIWAHFQMPDIMPVHFNGSGEPDRLSSKNELTIAMTVIGLLNLLIFGFAAPQFSKIPNKYFNLPHKEHWLSPEYREESIADICYYYLAMGIVTVLLLQYIHWGVYEVAMKKRETLPLGMTSVVIFLVVIGILCFQMIRRFYKHPPGSET